MAFDTDNKGNIILFPMMGWETAIAYEGSVILRVIYAEEPSDIQNGGKAIQLVLNPDKAVHLAEILRKSAEVALRKPPSETPVQ